MITNQYSLQSSKRNEHRSRMIHEIWSIGEVPPEWLRIQNGAWKVGTNRIITWRVTKKQTSSTQCCSVKFDNLIGGIVLIHTKCWQLKYYQLHSRTILPFFFICGLNTLNCEATIILCVGQISIIQLHTALSVEKIRNPCKLTTVRCDV